MPKTKIICTLGPASGTETIIRKMMLAGMDVVRLNFSHGTPDGHASRIELVRRLNKKYRRHIRILLDLEGFRIRISAFKGIKEIPLKRRQTLWLTQDEKEGGNNVVSFDYKGSLNDIKTGQYIFVDDGNIGLIVKGRSKKRLKTEVIRGGVLRERKGINMPGARLRFNGITDKDKRDIQFAIEHGVDYIAQSFVRNKEDILAVKELICGRLPACRIIAKIENRDGIKNIDEIIKSSDGIMIARGDMGISIPIYEVPFVQKMIIRKCNISKKPAVTATQMLESMTENLLPTRAEVADVANAVLDGSDHLMLSAETAVGNHPVEVVRMMNEIIRFTEEKR